MASSDFGKPLPELVVLDLDDCCWQPEMFTLRDVPTSAVRGPLEGGEGNVAAALKCGNKVTLFEGVRYALGGFLDGKYPGMRFAIASSADNSQAVACVSNLLSGFREKGSISIQRLVGPCLSSLDRDSPGCII